MKLSPATLPDNWQSLVASSRLVRSRAYAPFSKFAVGAAVRTSDGEVFTGCNVENSSYGLTICAERVAACAAVAAGHRDLDVVCVSLDGSPSPCGACRQFLNEFNATMLVILDDINRAPDTPPECTRLSDLLPRGFRLDG